jgi:hypothetical protein
VSFARSYCETFVSYTAIIILLTLLISGLSCWIIINYSNLMIMVFSISLFTGTVFSFNVIFDHIAILLVVRSIMKQVLRGIAILLTLFCIPLLLYSLGL